MDESACIKALDDWIKSKKEPIYERNFKGPSNSPEVLQVYRNELGTLCMALRRAIWSNNPNDLDVLEFPQELKACTQDANMRLEMCDRIKQWLITFPNVKNAQHLDKLLAEE
jgi:hypothetical protein